MRLPKFVKNYIHNSLRKYGYQIQQIDPTQLSQKERYKDGMKVAYLRRSGSWNQKLLCITHSDRPIESKYRSLNYLEKRFSHPNRLPPEESFETLWSSSHFSTQLGQVTVWGFRNGDFSKPVLLAHLCTNPNGYKPQFAIWYKSRLWILGIEGIEVYNSDLSRISVITDPWLSGGHTIAPDYQGHLLVSCSGSDSVLVIDENTYEVVNALRVPEQLYGTNYPLSRQDSTVEHYIDNDRQLTHLNCAWPWNKGVLVSNFIQGAIGWFDQQGNYTELLRGFVGCHGARIDYRTNQIYFSDSCLGAAVFLNSSFGIARRVDAESTWLHDTQQLKEDIFALAVADRNRVEIMNFSSRQVTAKISGDNFGNTTQFVYYGE